MKRPLLRSTAFVRAAKRCARKRPQLATDLMTWALFAENAFDSRLKTHKLKGEFQGSWACSAGYDLSIVFEFVPYEGAEAILLETIGTHDEVY